MSQEASRRFPPERNHHRRETETEAEDDGDDEMRCSGKCCKSFAAGCIADCVALCCCPCAVVNFFTFALFKVPWAVGKRILKHEKKKKQRRKREKVTKEGVSLEKRAERETFGFEFSGGRDEFLMRNFSFTTRFEEEEVIFELYQDGYLEFGRVSFTGSIPSFCSSNSN